MLAAAVGLMGCEPVGYSTLVVDGVHLLVRDDAPSTPLLVVGREFDPGAFGVHWEAALVGVTPLAHGLVEVRSEEVQNDLDRGGLELTQVRLALRSVCGAEGCTPALPISVVVAHGPGADPDEGEEYVVRTWSEVVHLRHTLDAQGVLVELADGDEQLVPDGVLGHHAFSRAVGVPRWLE